jgi:hypothetical protein
LYSQIPVYLPVFSICHLALSRGPISKISKISDYDYLMLDEYEYFLEEVVLEVEVALHLLHSPLKLEKYVAAMRERENWKKPIRANFKERRDMNDMTS